ncbi:DUF1217 domain-containing protein [Pseudooceanicola sp.]|uniref:DUF1217 domain-containing protein n=1 Tax=Pseudooceanicola sp. TaxID=1914328 RepID=UPI0035C73396
MIPISGLPSLTALNLVDATRDKQLDLIRNSTQHSRAIAHFRENIADVETVDQLLEDQDLYAFVMRAFDLEDQIFGKAMIEKVLKSNIEESGALVNRLTDTRFREMYEELGFGTDGKGNLNTILKGWQNRMVDRYVERQFINAAWDQNETVATALEFRKAAADIDSPFDILKSSTMTSFVQTAFGLPKQLSGLDIDKQAEIISAKIDFDELDDPAAVEKMIRKYVAISEALNGSAVANNAALQMLTGNVGTSTNSIFSILEGAGPIRYSAARY